MGVENEIWIACVLPSFDLTYRAFGAKESKLGLEHAAHARSKPTLNSSDFLGVVLMFSRTSAVPNGPGEPSMDCVCFALVGPHLQGIRGQGVKARLYSRSACAV
jgi:hypothetical protein